MFQNPWPTLDGLTSALLPFNWAFRSRGGNPALCLHSVINLEEKENNKEPRKTKELSGQNILRALVIIFDIPSAKRRGRGRRQRRSTVSFYSGIYRIPRKQTEIIQRWGKKRRGRDLAPDQSERYHFVGETALDGDNDLAEGLRLPPR